jgi:hypothetical protein
MSQTFINLRFDQIEKRFNEVELLLKLAEKYLSDFDTYQSLCRSAHVLLISHFEGLYKDISKDIIYDLNSNTHFFEIKKAIFNTHCNYFLNSNDSEKATQKVKEKLWQAFKEYPSQLKFEPFLFVDNKNPTPEIIESILEKFGVKNFFSSIDGSDLDIVFEDQKTKTLKLRNRLLIYLKKGTNNFPYTIDTSIYNPNPKNETKKGKTLWEDFINSFLKERHDIIHGHTLDSPNDHESLSIIKMKIEIVLYAFIINLTSASNPIIFLDK